MIQKRYTAQFEIESDIIRAKRDMVKLSMLVEINLKKVKEHYDVANTPDTEPGVAVFHRASGDELNRKTDSLKSRVASIENVKIPSLTRTLAAFKTDVFPFMGDKAVVRQK